jgi:hypothetical protein
MVFRCPLMVSEQHFSGRFFVVYIVSGIPSFASEFRKGGHVLFGRNAGRDAHST